jgi:mutator protein MutT
MSGGRSRTAKFKATAKPLAGESACPTVCQPAAVGSKKDDGRRYPKWPLIGVGALIFRRGRILMAQRGKEPLKGAWSLPGGALETGESLDAAVRREVREETGLEVKPVKIFEIFERIMRDSHGAAEYHYVLIDYLCRVTGGDLLAGDDVCRVEWVRERDLTELEITEGTLAVIERAFRENVSARRVSHR